MKTVIDGKVHQIMTISIYSMHGLTCQYQGQYRPMVFSFNIINISCEFGIG